jgi:hypothetical protein
MKRDTVRNFYYAGTRKEELTENLTVPDFMLKKKKKFEKPPVLRQRFQTRPGVAQSVWWIGK